MVTSHDRCHWNSLLAKNTSFKKLTSTIQFSDNLICLNKRVIMLGKIEVVVCTYFLKGFCYSTNSKAKLRDLSRIARVLKRCQML